MAKSSLVVSAMALSYCIALALGPSLAPASFLASVGGQPLPECDINDEGPINCTGGEDCTGTFWGMWYNAMGLPNAHRIEGNNENCENPDCEQHSDDAADECELT